MKSPTYDRGAGSARAALAHKADAIPHSSSNTALELRRVTVPTGELTQHIESHNRPARNAALLEEMRALVRPLR